MWMDELCMYVYDMLWYTCASLTFECEDFIREFLSFHVFALIGKMEKKRYG